MAKIFSFIIISIFIGIQLICSAFFILTTALGKEFAYYSYFKIFILTISLPIFNIIVSIYSSLVIKRVFTKKEKRIIWGITFGIILLGTMILTFYKFEWTKEKVELRKQKEKEVCFYSILYLFHCI